MEFNDIPCCISFAPDRRLYISTTLPSLPLPRKQSVSTVACIKEYEMRRRDLGKLNYRDAVADGVIAVSGRNENEWTRRAGPASGGALSMRNATWSYWGYK